VTIAAAGADGIGPRSDKRAYYHLFIAQVLSLVSTGVATVALSLLAFDLVEGEAGAVIGAALAIKMAANVVVAPLAAALVTAVPRRPLFAALLLVRAGCALAMLLVTSVAQVFGLILIFQIAAAIFTPAYLAAVPEVLPREQDYAGALSRARLAYELEAIVSPALASVLLLVVSDRGLFVTTAAMTLVAMSVILHARLPSPAPAGRRPIRERITEGALIFLATPRLRGLLALELAVAAAAAMVTVNTVVIVQQRLGLGEQATAIAFTLFGAGSVLGALLVPRLLRVQVNRKIMLGGGAIATIALLAGMVFASLVSAETARLAFLLLAGLWLVLGFGCALAEVPYGTLLARSGPEIRQSLYATHFALAHLTRLIAYPLAGTVGAVVSIPAAFGTLAVVAGLAVAAAAMLWPQPDAWTIATDPAASEHRELVSEEAR
jgi:MFS family permease